MLATRNNTDNISALYLCADILQYPNSEYKHTLKKLENVIGVTINTLDMSLDDIRAEYIAVFSMRTTAQKCVPYASWWIDGKMAGSSLVKIITCYRQNGYIVDINNMKTMSDHVALMLAFVAILLEENKLKELQEFMVYLDWLENLANSLKEATPFQGFYYAVVMASRILNSLKEDL